VRAVGSWLRRLSHATQAQIIVIPERWTRSYRPVRSGELLDVGCTKMDQEKLQANLDQLTTNGGDDHRLRGEITDLSN
jgi:hypothetical protein